MQECTQDGARSETDTHTHNNAVQWSLSIEDTTGTQLEVLYREVSPIQRYICTQLYVLLEPQAVSSLAERCPSFKLSLYRGPTAHSTI